MGIGIGIGAAGISIPTIWKFPCFLATAAPLPANIQTGSVLTGAVLGALGLIDGTAVPLNTDILISQEGAPGADKRNGIYRFTTLGDAFTAWSCKRSPHFDTSGEVFDGMVVTVQRGATLAGHMFEQVASTPLTINVDPIEFRDLGSLAALVTTVNSGSVAAFGATVNTKLQSDGVTPGGIWRSDLRWRATALAAGDLRFDASALVTAEDSASAAQANLMQWDGATLYLGDGTKVLNANLTGKNNCSLNVGAVGMVQCSAASVLLTNTHLWLSRTLAATDFGYEADPLIGGTGGVRPELLHHGQDSLVAGSTGGRWAARAGHGVLNHGVLALQDADGQDRLSVTATNGLVFNGTTTDFFNVGAVTSSGNPAWNLGTGTLTTPGSITLSPLGGGADDLPNLVAAEATGKIPWLAPGTYNFSGTAYVTARTVRALHAVGTAQSIAMKVVNPTAATVGVQQYSPAGSFEGRAWDVTAGASAPVNALIQCRGVQGASVAQAQFDVWTGKVGSETLKFTAGGASIQFPTTIPVQFGAAPGTPGAAGGIGLTDTMHVVAFNTASHYALIGLEATHVIVGGAYPTRPDFVDCDGTSGVQIKINGSTRFSVDTKINLVLAAAAWNSALAAPSLSQAADATAGVTADALTIASQSATDATAANFANGLLLKGGDVAGLLASTAGNVEVKAGSATAAGVGSVGGSVLLTVGLGATNGNVKVTNGALWCEGTTGATPTSGAGTRLMWIPAKGAFRAGTVAGASWDAASIGTGSVALGLDCIASATSFAFGSGGTTAGHNWGAAFGYAATTTCQGQWVHAANRFSVLGDAQRSSASLQRSSVDAASTELTAGGSAPGAGTRLVLASGKTYLFRLEVATVCTAGTNVGACASWLIEGQIKNIGGTTALVGTPQVRREGAVSAAANVACTPTHSDAAIAAATCQVLADDANDSLQVLFVGVIGGAANTFHTHAGAYLSEVG